jgi:hypothetical protein
LRLVDGQDVSLKKFYKDTIASASSRESDEQPIYVEPEALQIQGVGVG